MALAHAGAARPCERPGTGAVLSQLQFLAPGVDLDWAAGPGILSGAARWLLRCTAFCTRWFFIPCASLGSTWWCSQYGDVPPLTAAGLLALIAIAGGIILRVFSLGIALASRRNAAAGLRACAFLVGDARIRARAFADHRISVESGGLRGKRQPGLVQLRRHRNLRPEFPGGRLWLAARVRDYFGPATRMEGCAIVVTAGLILVARRRQLILSLRRSRITSRIWSRRISRNRRNIRRTGSHPCARTGRIRAHQRGRGAGREPGLIVWPEVPAPFSLQDPAFGSRAQQIARESGSDFLVGVEDWKQDAAGKWHRNEQRRAAKSVRRARFHIRQDSSGAIRRIRSAAPLAHVRRKAHRRHRRFHARAPRISVGKLPGGRQFGAFICYEAIFPNEVRRFTPTARELLINMSNDGWFGRSSAPAQHLMMARVRAVENRRWLLRDTNNGFTVSVDPYGRIVAELPHGYSRRTRCPLRFPQRPHAVHALRRLVRLALRDCLGQWQFYSCYPAEVLQKRSLGNNFLAFDFFGVRNSTLVKSKPV